MNRQLYQKGNSINVFQSWWIPQVGNPYCDVNRDSGLVTSTECPPLIGGGISSRNHPKCHTLIVVYISRSVLADELYFEHTKDGLFSFGEWYGL